MRDIPALVREIRRARNLTQEQLAHLLGVTFSTVNGWENGRHRPIPSLVAALERLAIEDDSGTGQTSIRRRGKR
jgi:transcriptional regulator with XRE-family HTH domain